MRPVLKAFLLLLGLAVMLGAIGLWYVVNAGVSAKDQPGRAEEFIARRVRNKAIARRAQSLIDPVESRFISMLVVSQLIWRAAHSDGKPS